MDEFLEKWGIPLPDMPNTDGLPPPGAETLGEALLDLPSDAMSYIEESGVTDWIGDTMADAGDMAGDLLGDFLQPITTTLLGIVGGLPFVLLGIFGFKLVAAKVTKKKKESPSAMYMIPPKDIDPFLAYLGTRNIKATYTNYDRGLITVPRSQIGQIDAMAKEYMNTRGAQITRLGK